MRTKLKKKLSVRGLYIKGLFSMVGVVVVSSIVLWCMVLRLMGPFFIAEQARLVQSEIKERESTLNSAILHQDFSTAYSLIESPGFISEAKRKYLHLFTMDNYSKYALKSNCTGEYQDQNWGAQCLSSGKMTFEIPLKAADNTLAHIEVTLADTMWGWEPLRIIGICIFVTLLIAIATPFFFVWRFRKTFAEPIQEAMSRMGTLEDPQALAGLVAEVPLKEIHDLTSMIMDKQQQLQFAHQKISVLEFRNEALKMTSKIAHDIKGPIASIGGTLASGPVDVAKKETILTLLARIRVMIESHLEKMKRLGALNEGDSTLPKLENVTPDEMPASFGAALSSAIRDLEGLSSERKVRVIHVIEKDSFSSFVSMDFFGLYRCFLNILTNAIEASQEGAAQEVNIYALRAQAVCEVVIKDSGKGFDKEVLKAFQRGKNISTKADNKCRGFGLVTARDEISKANGSLFIESGESGSSVRIVLPVSVRPVWFQNIQDSTVKDLVSLDDDSEFQKKIQISFPNSNLVMTQDEDSFSEAVAKYPNALALVDLDFGGSIDGVSVIEKYDIKARSVLVSGRVWCDSKLAERSNRAGVRIFPKECLP